MSDESGQTLRSTVTDVLPDALDLSHRVHAHPETAFEELHPMMAIAPRETPGHSREFAKHAGGPGGDGMLPIAIEVLAATALDLIRRPELVTRAWDDHARQGGAAPRPRA